jgi:hypothetical protein
MQKKLTWFLTVLAIGLFAFIYFVERKVPSTAESAAPQRLFAGIEPQSVTAVQIALPGGAVVRAEQTNGIWFLTKPFYPAQQSAIEIFVTNVTRLRGFDRLANHEVVLQGQKSFGLEPPRAKVQVESATNRFEFEVGGDAPLTNNIYVRILPSADVVLTEADLLQTLPVSPNDWRSGRLLQLSSIPFDRLQLRSGQRVVELARNATNKNWQITRPIPARADQNQIAIMLDQLSRAQIGEFVADGAVPLEKYGLQNPEVALGLSQGTNRLFSVEFGGSATNQTNFVYARLLGNTNLVTVPRELVDYLKQPYKAFHDPRLMTIENPAALDRIRIDFLEEFDLKRGPDGRWMVGGTNAFPADVELLAEFLTKVLGLRILDIAKEVPTEADHQALGLREPVAKYSFYNKATNAPGVDPALPFTELSFGTNSTDRIYVARSDETPVYVTEFAKFLELPRSAYELRDRQIWRVSTGDVVRVSLVSSNVAATAVRAGEIWSSDPIVNEAIGEAVFRLGSLKALRWVTQVAERKASLGIVPGGEVIEVEVKKEGGTEVLRIPIGKLTMRRDVYAEHPRVHSLIFEFPGDIYHLLKQNLPLAK